MRAQSKPLMMALLSAVCIHTAAFGLTLKFFNDNKLEPKNSLTGGTTIVLNHTTSTPANQQTNEPTAKNTINGDLVPTKPLIEPTTKPGLKTQAKTTIAKEAMQPALKTTPIFELLAKTKPAKKVETEKVSRGLPPLAAQEPAPAKAWGHVEGEHVAPKQSLEKQVETMPKIKTTSLMRPANTFSEPEEVKVNYALVSANDSDPSSNQHTVNTTPNTAATDVSLALENYYTALGSWLAKHKKYPHRARQRKQEGTALLHFVVDRNGQILEHTVAKSSGHKLLDKEVSAMLKRAEPLPEMPDLIHQAKLEITVPIEFFLR